VPEVKSTDLHTSLRTALNLFVLLIKSLLPWLHRVMHNVR